MNNLEKIYNELVTNKYCPICETNLIIYGTNTYYCASLCLHIYEAFHSFSIYEQLIQPDISNCYDHISREHTNISSFKGDTLKELIFYIEKIRVFK
jgi:hypothetical protein